MTGAAQHDARIARALAVLALTLPALTGISLAQDTPPQVTTPATSPTQVVGEQAGTAREIVPFGAAVIDAPSGTTSGGAPPPTTPAGPGSSIVVWAVGQTRGPTPEPPSTPTTPVREFEDEERPSIPIDTTPRGDEDEDEDGPQGSTPDEPEPAPLPGLPTTPPAPTSPTTPLKRPVDELPQPSSPPVNVLLTGTAAGPDAPTAWKRTELPLDAKGDPLPAGSWRPAGAAVQRQSPPAPAGEAARAANASPNAGDATLGGAAALLVRLAEPSPAAGVLVRRSDGRFQVLPGAPPELVAPAEQFANPDATTDLAPLAVVDAPAAKPAATTPDGASTPPVPSYGRTGVLLVPPGGDGVLVWDGTAWSEEPFQDADGATAAPASTPVAVAATPDGDAVALVAGNDTSSDRITVYRRLADHSGWRPMTLESPLLSGPLPAGIEAVRPSVVRGEGRAGDPLTVAPGHWWIDLLVRRAGGATVAATVHLRPGPSRAAAPDPVSTTPGPTDPAGTTPGPTDPAATGPAPTGPAATSPAPTSTSPDAPPTDPLVARATGTFCVASTPTADATKALDDDAKLCTGELPAGFPTGRGYRSQAFATQGALPSGAPAATAPAGAADSRFGGRIITSPVAEPDADTAAARDSSASGGYLRLTGGRFTLEGGLGETPDATGRTETAAFISDLVGWTGGDRIAGRVMRSAAVRAGTYATTTPPIVDAPLDASLSPPDAGADTGVLFVSALGMRREFDDERSPTSAEDTSLWDYTEGETKTIRSVAWLPGNRAAVVGTNGLFLYADPPSPTTPRVQYDFEGYDLNIAVDKAAAKAAEGLDLVDIAVHERGSGGVEEPSAAGDAADGPEPGGSPAGPGFEGWAVGRDGAAVKFAGYESIGRVELTGPLARADLRQVAYAGSQAYVASSVGLLAADGDQLELDRDLAAMIEADGRLPEVRTVAGLPDGAVVVDARYVKNGREASWERLASPAEGDVVAVSLARPGGDPSRGARSLRVYASIADRARPRIGELDRRLTGYDDDDPTYEVTERAVQATEGRLVELTPDGWIDRNRLPLRRGDSIDVGMRQIPIEAIVTDASGRGWAVGGSGSGWASDRRLEETTAVSVRISDAQVLTAPPWPAGSPSPAPATTPSSPDAAAGSTPEPLPEATPESLPIKLLIGGHPTCLETCTGREDQRIAPLSNVQHALAASARMRRDVQAVIIGGGRSPAAQPLSRAAASGYADLLRSEPAAPPVFAALGSGDAGTEKNGQLKRETFLKHVVDPLKPPAAAVATGLEPRLVELPGPASPAGSAAYAFDVPGERGGAARVVVIDNTTDEPLRGGLQGPQGRWLDDVLRDATERGRATVVIGAAPLDRADRTAARHMELLEPLLRHRVAAYVSTDGDDDRTSLRFGMHERSRTISFDGSKLLLVHSSTLGHAMPAPVWNRLSPYADSEDDEDAEAIRDYRDRGASLVELTLPPAAGGARARAETVSVVREIKPPELTDLYLGAADPVWLPTINESQNGMRWVDPLNQQAGEQVTSGNGLVQYTVSALCSIFAEEAMCDGDLPADWEFSVEDPSIARFVRAEVKVPRRKGKDRQDDDSNRDTGRPVIATDAQGNPIVDSTSQVLCPLKIGTTWASVTSGGETVRWRIRVLERPDYYGELPGGAKCGFIWAQPPSSTEPEPKPAAPAIPAPIVIPTPPLPDPGPAKAKTKPPGKTAPSLPPRTPLLLAPVDVMSTAAPPSAVPPVAPNPKPVQPPSPAPPSGVTTQQVPSHIYGQIASPVTAAQAIAVQQAERRHEVAREGVDHQAVAYAAEPLPAVRLLLAGGALAFLTALGGALAGRRRALARAAARRYLR